MVIFFRRHFNVLNILLANDTSDKSFSERHKANISYLDLLTGVTELLLVFMSTRIYDLRRTVVEINDFVILVLNLLRYEMQIICRVTHHRVVFVNSVLSSIVLVRFLLKQLKFSTFSNSRESYRLVLLSVDPSPFRIILFCSFSEMM